MSSETPSFPIKSLLTKTFLTAGGIGLAYHFHGGPTWTLAKGILFLLLSSSAATGYEQLLTGEKVMAAQLNASREYSFNLQVRALKKEL